MEHPDVPLALSLSADAPGYAGAGADELGPICWKCKGTCVKAAATKPNRRALKRAAAQDGGGANGVAATPPPCSVCAGKGRLPPSRKRRKQLTAPAVPPRTRRPPGWLSRGPPPACSLEETGATLG